MCGMLLYHQWALQNIMWNLVSELDLNIVTSTQRASLDCHCTRGHFADSKDTQRAKMVLHFYSVVELGVEERLLSSTDGFYFQSRERTNVLLYGTLPVWIPMKGLVYLDLGPGNGWFNTMSFTIYLGSWCFTSGTMCLYIGLRKEKSKWNEGTLMTCVGHVVVVRYSQCQTGQLPPVKPLSVISMYFNSLVVYLDCGLGHIFLK